MTGQKVNTGDTPPDNRVLFTLLAFIFGTVFVITLLIFATAIPVPTSFQIWVFRTVLSLAAAGVAAVIPGMLGVRFGKWLTAGGALAVFVIVYTLNPPDLITQAKSSAVLDRAAVALLSGNYGFAKSLYQEAIRMAPNDYEPVFNLARAEYELGNYLSAKRLYEDAYTKSGTNDNTRNKLLLYSVSLIYEADNQLDAAINNYESVRLSLDPQSDVHLDILFSEGQLYIKKALNTSEHADDYLAKADEYIKLFIERGGKPTQWAHYHLACVNAIRASKITDETASKQIQAIALTNLKLSIYNIKSFNGKTAMAHFAMMKHLIYPSQFYPWRPGFPVECQPLRTIAKDDKEIQNLLQ